MLTDNGMHFPDPSGDGWTPEDIKAMWAEKVLFRCNSFEAACADLEIEHRLSKPRHHIKRAADLAMRIGANRANDEVAKPIIVDVAGRGSRHWLSHQSNAKKKLICAMLVAPPLSCDIS